jgi:hypothetical protein
MELAVPDPVEGAGLLLTATLLFSKFQAVIRPPCDFIAGPRTNADASTNVARPFRLMYIIFSRPLIRATT